MTRSGFAVARRDEGSCGDVKSEIGKQKIQIIMGLNRDRTGSITTRFTPRDKVAR